jgi:alkylhydroperoxidase/carboxymuconolactone decarboxylase family protein YurZ
MPPIVKSDGPPANTMQRIDTARSHLTMSPADATATAAPASCAAAPAATPTCDRLKAAGHWNAAWDPIYELDRAWTEGFIATGLKPLPVLDPKTVEFIAIAVDASCTHLYAPGVRRHIRQALALGATKEEVAAVLQLTSVLGIHTMSLAAPILLDELAARDAAGVHA